MSNVAQSSLYSPTPTLSVKDARGLQVRSVAYHRSQPIQKSEARITRQAFDANARLESSWDPRLFADQKEPNLTTLFSLSAQPLLTKRVDAGWRLNLLGSAGELLCEWDGRQNLRTMEYDHLLRPITVTEGDVGEPPPVTERMNYASSNIEFSPFNQCGKLIRHDDTAGSVLIEGYGVSGATLSECRRFMHDLLTPDWPVTETERDKKLEVEVTKTQWKFNAMGDLHVQIDARGNQQVLAYDVSGQIKEVQLKRQGLPDKILLKDVLFSPTGQIESATAGNGINTTRYYEAEDDRLIQLTSSSPGHAFQAYTYVYDPLGNIISIRDSAQAVHYFKNQRTVPVNNYRYDSLNQLIESTGRESIPASQGQLLPELQIPCIDPQRMSAYKQMYSYDLAGNLKTLIHEGRNGYTREIVTDINSNRSLLRTGIGEPDFRKYFDSNGNIQTLLPSGKSMHWDTRNQLREVVQITRKDEENDSEVYAYNGQGQRLRKVLKTKTKAGSRISEVRYLNGLEIHFDNAVEVRHVVNIAINNCRFRILHWETEPPDNIAKNQICYGFDDHLGSCTLELAEDTGLLSQEGYYPFGGTAWQAARSELDSKFKTIRHSGKDLDSTGLYYYGYRYYAPWLMRWLNPDPADETDGLNLYIFVKNSPICRIDEYGLDSEIAITKKQYWFARLTPLNLVSSKAGALLKPMTPNHISLQPSTLKPNGEYKQSSGFKIKKIESSEALKILNEFKGKYVELINFMNLENTSSKENTWSIEQIKNMSLGANTSYGSTILINLVKKEYSESVNFFKLIDRKNNVHAFTMTTRLNTSLSIDHVVSHPFSQFSDLSIGQREHLYAKLEKISAFRDFDSFATKKTGSTIAFLASIKEIKNSPTRIKTIKTDAINVRSKNIVRKFVTH